MLETVDLNRLDYYETVSNMPAVRPRYVVAVPFRADTFANAYSHASQMGATTLDEYFAPDGIFAPGSAQGNSYAIAGNGIVLAGNAPTTGIYTGIQQE